MIEILLTWEQIEAQVRDRAEFYCLSDADEADLLQKVRRGFLEHAGEATDAKTMADVKRCLRAEALDLIGYGCLVSPLEFYADTDLLRAGRSGAELLQLFSRMS